MSGQCPLPDWSPRVRPRVARSITKRSFREVPSRHTFVFEFFLNHKSWLLSEIGCSLYSLSLERERVETNREGARAFRETRVWRFAVSQRFGDLGEKSLNSEQLLKLLQIFRPCGVRSPSIGLCSFVSSTWSPFLGKPKYLQYSFLSLGKVPFRKR